MSKGSGGQGQDGGGPSDEAAKAVVVAFPAGGSPPDGPGEGPAASPGPSPGPCPVRCLGRADGWYFFLSPRAEYRALRYRDMSALGIDSLFEGDDTWLRLKFPRYSKAREGEQPEVIGYAAPAAARWLMGEAGKAGFFDPTKSLRGTSVWLDEMPGRKRGEVDRGLLIHCGDALLRFSAAETAGGELVQRRDIQPGLVRAGPEGRVWVYPARPAESRPASVAASQEEMRELWHFLHRWNWVQPSNSPTLILGWLACGVIAGLLRWRPHIWVTGGAGTGKSTLEYMMSEILASTVLRLSAPTEAGVRQQLGPSARPVMLDEIEPSEANTRASEVVALARIASTDRQAPVGRGSVNGVPSNFPIRAVFYLTSILHAPLIPQDAQRITVLDLGQLLQPLAPEEGAEAAPLDDILAKYIAQGPKLRARIIYGWRRYERNMAVFKVAFARAGRKARLADQYGTLLAAALTLLQDEPVTAEQALREVERLQEGAILPDEAMEDDPRQCLNHLLTTPIEESQASGVRLSGTISIAIWKHFEDGTYADALRVNGLRVERRQVGDERGDGFDLWVANDHRGMRRIYADTRWREGVWSQSLKRLPGASPGPSPQRIGGVKVRYVAVPCEVIERPWEGTRPGIRGGTRDDDGTD